MTCVGTVDKIFTRLGDGRGRNSQAQRPPVSNKNRKRVELYPDGAVDWGRPCNNVDEEVGRRLYSDLELRHNYVVIAGRRVDSGGWAVTSSLRALIRKRRSSRWAFEGARCLHLE